MNNLQDKCRGSLVGGAAGDTLGYPVEFVYSFEGTRCKYGEDGVTEYNTRYLWLGDSVNHDKALFSDDTQMSLYTAEGLVESEHSARSIVPTICNSYLAWYGLQYLTFFRGQACNRNDPGLRLLSRCHR